MGMDNSWEDQWKGLTSLAKRMHAMDHFTEQAYHSPSASESSFSVSTRTSPSFSAQSEASPFAPTYTPNSLDLPNRRVCKIGLFYNPPIVKHAKSPSMETVSQEEEKHQDGLLLQARALLEDIQRASALNVPQLVQNDVENFVEAKETQLVQSLIGVSDEGWVSDSSESWASASSRELSAAYYLSDSNETDEDVSSSSLCETPQIYQSDHFHEQGEIGWGTKEQAGHAAASHFGIANQYDHENANITEIQSYAEFKDENAGVSEVQSQAELDDEIILNDDAGYVHESVPVQSKFDNQTSAPVSGPSGLLDVCSLSEPHATGLETRHTSRYKGLHSRGHAKNPNLNMPCNWREEGDVSCTINADCFVEDCQEPQGQAAGGGHEPLACDFLNVENIAVQLREHVLKESCLTDSRYSAYINSVGHSKEAHLKTRHSAAVERRYPSSSLNGHFRLVEQDGSQCYSFSVHNSNTMYFARAACEPENEEGPGYMYTFHCRMEEGKRKGGRKTSLEREKLASRLVGKMKVFTAMRMPADNGCVEETHFVLYGEKSQLPPEKETCSNDSQGIHTVQVELAALVIKTTVKEYRVTQNTIWESSLEDGAGWGAAFLDKNFKRRSRAGYSLALGSEIEAAAPEDNHAACHMERHQESTNWAEKILNKEMSHSKREQPNIEVDVVVILPAGHHGLPRHQNQVDDRGAYGPTSLLECWQTGGNCHCGGWDAGCGLSVLKATTFKMHKPTETIALTNRDRINWITPQKPLQIFTQGWKQRRLLMLEMVQTGLFSLSFQARFSPLQAFATVVAIFHEQITHK